MKTKFTNSFFASLKRYGVRYTWWYKIYEFFRYSIPHFFSNMWRFRKALNNYYWWDYNGILLFIESSLKHMSDNLEIKGLEIDTSRLKKVQKMRRAIEIIKNITESGYIELAEKEVGSLIESSLWFEPIDDTKELFEMKNNLSEEESSHNSKVYNRAHELEELEWIELIEILKGQDYSKFDKNIDFYDQFDGSGLRGWWD